MDRRATILIVDDSSANLQLCKGLLGGEFDVRLAKSGKMALDALARMRPDVVLLDIEMPYMSGFEVMDNMRKNTELKDVPIIFVTSHATEKLIVKAMGQGAADYIVKPFVPDVLRAKVRNVLRKP